jgi:CRISPR-associated protein Csm1
MSFQIFLHGKILGTEEFLRSAANDIEGRAQWASLLSEVTPRALLAELGLSAMLLGASGGGQFLLVIPAEARAQAEEFLSRVAADAAQRSGGAIRLVWAITENLGNWTDVRRRLREDLQRRAGAPAAIAGTQMFDPAPSQRNGDFSKLASEFRDAPAIGWSPEEPTRLLAGSGKYTWPVGSEGSAIPFIRHAALNDQDSAPAGVRTLASRAKGRRTWGVLRGSVDGLSSRLEKALTIEEHLATSDMFKRFIGGEISVLGSLPDFWRKISLLYAGADGFAIYGAWDALIAFARELQRVFQIFVDANLRDHAGMEGKTISMAIALARTPEQSLADVYAESGDMLEVAKAAGRDSIYVLNRVLEWKQLADAAETKQVMTRLIKEFRCSPELLNELASFYRESDTQWGVPNRSRNDRVDRPWRFHRRINMVLGASRETHRNREFQRLRGELVSDFTGKKAAHVRLRPQGRVALEWTRLETGA